MSTATKDISVVFFGSGPVAAESLELLAQDFTIEAVITKPQPEHHKADFPVLKAAEDLKLKVYTTANKAELSEIFQTNTFTSKVGVLIDYGIIVNQDVIDYFPLGIVNSHFSLLPEWRGADPITFSILSGQKETGVSIMLLVAALDEGPLLGQAPYTIAEGMTTPELTTELIQLSHTSLVHLLPLYIDGETVPVAQLDVTMAASKQPTYSRKLSKEDGVLNFAKPAVQLEREVRAFIEWPRSRMALGGKDVIITAAHSKAGSGTPGTIRLVDKKISITTSDGVFVIDKLKPAGKPEMSASAFIAGYGHLLS